MVADRILTTYDANPRPFERGTQRAENRLNRFERGVTSRLDRFDRRFEQSARSVQRLGDAIRLALTVGGVEASRRFAEGFRQLQRDLAAVGVSGEAAEQSMVNLAIRVRSELTAVSGTVKKFSRATGDDIDASARRVETLVKLLTIGGASQTQAASVFTQLPQALQSGVLSGDEFRSVRENAPVEFLDALAKQAGVTRAELRGVAEAQELTSDIVLGALDDLAETADREFPKIEQSGAEAFAVLSTGLTFFVGKVDEATGATATLNSAMASIGQFLAAGSDEAKLLGEALQFAAQAALAIGGARVATGLAGLIARQAEARQAAVASTQAELAASRTAEAAARREIATRRDRLQVLIAEGAAQSKITAAQNAVRRATDAQVAAADRLGVATVAAANAQARLSLATRVSTAAMNGLRNAMAFFGGPIGLAITAASLAVFQLASNAADARARFEALKGPIGNIDSAIAALEA